MTVRIKCTTRFDITETGVKNRNHKARIVFRDATGREITNELDWNRARNQQCNWETVNQVISLRTLPENISRPVHNAETGIWSFEFAVIDPASVTCDGNPVGYLLNDCAGVPMILGLSETPGITPILISSGSDANIWFELLA
jgi:hypothetical protein